MLHSLVGAPLPADTVPEAPLLSPPTLLIHVWTAGRLRLCLGDPRGAAHKTSSSPTLGQHGSRAPRRLGLSDSPQLAAQGAGCGVGVGVSGLYGTCTLGTLHHGGGVPPCRRHLSSTMRQLSAQLRRFLCFAHCRRSLPVCTANSYGTAADTGQT